MEKVTVPKIMEMKKKGQKITMVTCYDFPFSRIVSESGVDMVLVGDSAGSVILGYENTLPVTMDEMIHHTKAVRRGLKGPLLVGDMPFMSYQVSIEEAVQNAGRFVKEGGAEAVKLEGGKTFAKTVRAIVDAGIPVMGHIGLTPQFINEMGGYFVQRAEEKLLDDAESLVEAGVFSIVLECVPEEIAKRITESIPVPTIGIGAGRFCDGQVLVLHDILGMIPEFRPKFVKRYENFYEKGKAALLEFVKEVREEKFPTEDHIFE